MFWPLSLCKFYNDNSLYTRRTSLNANLFLYPDSCTFLTGFTLHLSIISIPLRAQIVNVYDAIKSGLLLLPLMGAMAIGSALGGAMSSKKNLTFWTLNAASIFMLIGSGLMSTIPGTLSPAAKQWGFEIILGLGLGLNLSTSTLMTSLQAEFEDYSKYTRSFSSYGAQCTIAKHTGRCSNCTRPHSSNASFWRQHRRGCELHSLKHQDPE